jgi:hypothetical protein
VNEQFLSYWLKKMKFLYSALLRSAPEVKRKMLKQDDIVCQRPPHFTPLPSINSEPLQQKRRKRWKMIGIALDGAWNQSESGAERSQRC